MFKVMEVKERIIIWPEKSGCGGGRMKRRREGRQGREGEMEKERRKEGGGLGRKGGGKRRGGGRGGGKRGGGSKGGGKRGRGRKGGGKRQGEEKEGEEEEEEAAARARLKCALWKTFYKILTLSLGNSEQVLSIIESAVEWEVRFPFGRII